MGPRDKTPAGNGRGAGIVNTYFKQFYPAGWDDRGNFEFDGMWRWKGESRGNIFPRIECNDGFHFSVQGHSGAYSTPRDDFASEYSKVEVGFPSVEEPLLMEFAEDANIPTDHRHRRSDREAQRHQGRLCLSRGGAPVMTALPTQNETRSSMASEPQPAPDPATDSPETMAVKEMFNEWRDSDSELPFWAWTARGCR